MILSSLAPPVLLALATNPDGFRDLSTGEMYVPPVEVEPAPPAEGTPSMSILWVETQGTYSTYDSAGHYAAVINHMQSYASVTVHSAGAITSSLLSAYDVVIVPSLCNHDFLWSTPEIDAFDTYVQSGGGLYIWTDNSGTSHVAVTPLCAKFGITIGGSSGNDWFPTLPPVAGLSGYALAAGSLSGGTGVAITDTLSVTTGVYASVGSGRVAAIADGNVFAQELATLDNKKILDATLGLLAR